MRKKTPGIKISLPQKIQNVLKYLNADLFNQTDLDTLKKYMADLLTPKNTKGENFQPPKNMSDPLSCILRVPPWA